LKNSGKQKRTFKGGQGTFLETKGTQRQTENKMTDLYQSSKSQSHIVSPCDTLFQRVKKQRNATL